AAVIVLVMPTETQLPQFERYVAVRALGAPACSPTGDSFAYLANTTGLPGVWLQPADGGFPRHLTVLGEDRVAAFNWSPDGRRLAMMVDRHGDEMFQLHLMEVGGWPRQLTAAPQAQYALGDWSPDSTKLSFTGNDRDAAEQDAVVMDGHSGQGARGRSGGQSYAGDFSPDGSKLVVTEMISNTQQKLWVADLKSGERECVLGAEEDVLAKRAAIGWDGQGRGLYALTDSGHEFTYLIHVPLGDGPS